MVHGQCGCGLAGGAVGGGGADRACDWAEGAEVGCGLAVLLWRAGSRACVALVVAEGTGGTDLNADALSVGVGDDGGGDAGDVAVAVEEVETGLAEVAARKRSADEAFRVALRAYVDGDIVEVVGSWAVEDAGVVGGVSAVGDGALSDAEVGDGVGVEAV